MNETQPDRNDCDRENSIIKPKTKKASVDLLAQIAVSKVTSNASYDILEDLLVANKDLQKQVVAEFGPLKKQAHEMHAALCAKEKKFLGPLQAGERAGKAKLGVYAAFKAAEAKKAQDKIDLAVKAAAEKERKRLLAIAQRAEASGKAEKAEAALEAAQEVDEEDFVPAAPPRQTWTPSSSGRRANWQAKVTDFKALLQAVLDGKAPELCVIPNEAYLRSRAKADKAALNIPGVKAKDIGSMSVRSSRKF